MTIIVVAREIRRRKTGAGVGQSLRVPFSSCRDLSVLSSSSAIVSCVSGGRTSPPSSSGEFFGQRLISFERRGDERRRSSDRPRLSHPRVLTRIIALAQRFLLGGSRGALGRSRTGCHTGPFLTDRPIDEPSTYRASEFAGRTGTARRVAALAESPALMPPRWTFEDCARCRLGARRPGHTPVPPTTPCRRNVFLSLSLSPRLDTLRY